MSHRRVTSALHRRISSLDEFELPRRMSPGTTWGAIKNLRGNCQMSRYSASNDWMNVHVIPLCGIVTINGLNTSNMILYEFPKLLIIWSKHTCIDLLSSSKCFLDSSQYLTATCWMYLLTCPDVDALVVDVLELSPGLAPDPEEQSTTSD